MRRAILRLLLCLPLWAQTPAPDLRGIYIYTNDVSQITNATAKLLTQSLGIPGVDGVAVVIGWNAIEPSMGQYNWTLLDQWIGQVAALGKKIDLVVPAGVSTPSWLFQAAPAGAGATPLNFTITPHGGQTSQCQPETIAAPWDPAFLSQWDAMLGALAAHLKSAGTYNAVTFVRLTGVNRTTEELRLPAETAQSTGLACVTDAIATWQQAGYRPALLLQGWNAILASFLKSFPDKPFAVSVIPSGAFPPIDASGAKITGTPPDANLPLLSSASQKLPGRLVIQFDFLMPGEPASAVTIGYTQTFGTLLAFQTNEYMGGSGAACSEPVSNPTPCTDATFLTLLQTGIYPSGQSNPLRAQYIEVFHDNAAAFQDDILTAHSDLSPPAISLVANAEGESPSIAPNTWVEVKGVNLSPPGDTRIWQNSDFVGGKMPVSLDNVGVTVNGKAAFIYYISPTQINILTPPDALTGSVPVVVSVNGSQSAAYAAQAQPTSPSFFVIGGGPYVVAQHAANYALVGPPSLYAGVTTPAAPGETVVLYANGFGPTDTPVVSGSETQSGNLSPFPSVTIGGISANVSYAALISPGLYQINVAVPANAPSGDNQLFATVNGVATSPVYLLTIQNSTPATTANFYVSPKGNDTWSGALASPNPAGTDGPFATFDHARAAVAALHKTNLTQVSVQFRGGLYYLPATVQFTAADSGTVGTAIVYTNYPGESPVFSGGMRLQNWTNVSGNAWKTTLPASTQYFENLFYNGTRRLRPRLGGALGTFYRIGATVYLPSTAPNCTVNIPNLGWECFDRFQYKASDPIANTWKNYAPATGNPCVQPAGNQAIAGDVEILVFEQFSTSKLRIDCIDTANQIVYLTGPTPISQNNAHEVGFIAGNRYLVDNVQDDLTQPGQWFLDHSATPWTLTYLANAGENPNTDFVIAPQLPQLLAGTGLQYVTFHGLTFEHDNYTVPAMGHKSSELEADIPGAVSFQNSQHVTFDSGTVTQISGTGLEFISCVSSGSPAYCISTNMNAVTANDVVENSAFYDIGVVGVRIGDPYIKDFTDANEPQFMTVQNNVVEGYGRTIPASFGIGQGEGHDNLYTHNDVYDGYHCAVSISEQAPDTIKPAGMGNANNTISFNHVWNLLQGIMNDGGSIRIEAGNNMYTAPGNKILNNRIHDVTDASIQDSNGYGGNGIYLDNQTGLVDVENNLVYRVSANDVFTPQGPAAPNEANIVKNNILAYGRQGMVSVDDPYPFGVPPAANQVFVISNNLFYFDRSTSTSPKFYVQGGCVYSAGFPYTQFQEWNTNLYWRTDGGFDSDAKAFYVQPNAVATGNNPPCSGLPANWTFYTFAKWQTTFGEDAQSVVRNPGFNNPAYPNDDYTLPKGSPGAGFVVFDYTLAGRSNPVIHPPAIPATFPTMSYNPATDY